MLQRRSQRIFVNLLGAAALLLAACAPAPVLSPAALHAPSRFSILAVGDTGEAPSWRRVRSGQHAVASALAAERARADIDALVLLGDNFYPDGLEERAIVSRVRANLVAPYCAFVALHGTRSHEVRDACADHRASAAPIYAVLGNHDYNTPGSPTLQRHAVPLFVSNWHIPDALAEVVEFPAGVSLILLDSEALRRGGSYAAVESALRRAEGRWRILAAHHPIDLSPSASPNDQVYSQALRDAIADSGVAVHVLLAGHEHFLEIAELSSPGPTLQVISGGGSSVRPPKHPRDALAFRPSKGFARIDLLGSGERERLVASIYESVTAWNGRSTASHVASIEIEQPLASSQRARSRSLPPGDRTAGALRDYQREWLEARGGSYRDVDLREKAAFFSWQIDRYHTTPEGWVSPRVWLPESSDDAVQFDCGADQATWNGAYTAALAYEYATEKSPDVLERIVRHLDGLHYFIAATGEPGLAARCVVRSDEPFLRAVHPFESEDGTRYFWRGDSAKGTYNQLVLGYAALFMFAGADLPEQARARALEDLNALVLHLVDNDYRLTERGEPTKYGNLTPLLGSLGLPFNAQVAYMMTSTADAFAIDRAPERARLRASYQHLRDQRAYYEDPRFHWLVRPQRVGTSVFMQDMNDRNHVVNAAFTALLLDLHRVSRGTAEVDPQFYFELGRTLYWSMSVLEGEKNSLVNFMWAALLRDPLLVHWLLPKERELARAKSARGLIEGVEQLRRFRVDRLRWGGHEVETDTPQWIDDYRPDSYQWKANPRLRWEVTGPPANYLTSAIDYLHAYWLLRYFGLDEDPELRRAHGAVLGEAARQF